MAKNTGNSAICIGHPSLSLLFSTNPQPVKSLSKEWGTKEASAAKDGTASGRTCRRSFAQQETEFSAENTSQRLPRLETNRSFTISHLASTAQEKKLGFSN